MTCLNIKLILFSFLPFLFNLDDQGIIGVVANNWDYHGPLSPDRWHLLYPQCGGRQQSPVRIRSKNVVYNRALKPIVFVGYNSIGQVRPRLKNMGHTVEIDLKDQPILIAGGNLPGRYRAQQLHFHWGVSSRRGSEHDIDGYSYPMEMHILHYNTKYGQHKEAQSRADGLAVLAFFFRVGRHNPNLDEIITYIDKIKFKGEQIPLKSFQLASLLPSKFEYYYRYKGSSTIPPCYESVIWTIFKTPIDISENQLNHFRFLVNKNYRNQKRNKISENLRPVQPLYGRTIFSNDPSDYRPSSRSKSNAQSRHRNPRPLEIKGTMKLKDPVRTYLRRKNRKFQRRRKSKILRIRRYARSWC